MKNDVYPETGAVHIEGRNCWRVASAEKVRLIIDAQDYFKDLKTALLSARKEIFLIG